MLVKLKIFFNNSCLDYYGFIQNYLLGFGIPNKICVTGMQMK